MSINITIGLLIYRSKTWLDFVLESLQCVNNVNQYKTLIVANDPTEEIAGDSRISYIHRNIDPNEFYIPRVYRAWNKVVELCDTKYICLVNSDMAFSNGWLDELMQQMDGNTIPSSLLVESGRIPSSFPEYVHNFGTSPRNFIRPLWDEHAHNLRKTGCVEQGKLFMPVVFEREQFMAIGGYPEGNPKGISGDKFLFDKMIATGMRWITCMGSIVYHVQLGEQSED